MEENMLWQFILLACVFVFISLVFFVFFIHRLSYKRKIIINIDENHTYYTESEAFRLFNYLFRVKFKRIESDPDELDIVFTRQDYKKFCKNDYFEEDSLMILGKQGIHVSFR